MNGCRSEATAAGISNTIHNLNLSVDVANPNDPLNTSARLTNNDGDQLFSDMSLNSLIWCICYCLVHRQNGRYPADYGNI